MKLRHWIIISFVLGLAGWGGIFLAVKAILPPKLPEMVGPVERDSPIEPDSPIGLLLKEARAAEDAKNYQRAIELYSTAGIDDDKTPALIRRELLRQRALAYEDAQQYEQAEADHNSALKIEPIDPYAWRGFFFMRRKRYDEALADFAKGARLDSGNGQYAFGEGLVHEERGEYKRAIERLNEAVRLDPKTAIYYAARGSAHNYASMYREAYADYDKALLLGYPVPIPRQIARAHMGRGFASMMLRENRRAKDDFDHVLKVIPRDSNTLAWRGWTYKELGEKELAITDYKAALAIDPDNKLIAEQLKQLETR